ncbi:MAG: leucine-rich repeat protein, partial [Clostridia bacterium]|nr:leucine-rich repeat protein [Clostridia bacterium]
MLKRIFALILTLILTVVSIPIQAIAAEIGEWIPSPELPTSSGEVGLIDPVQVEVVDDLIVDHDNSDPALDYADLTPDTTGITGACTWALYGTELVISGNGKMADYNDTDNLAPWGNEITKVTIGSGVTNIGNSAFSSCKSLTSVTIPETVKNIGSFAFENASALTSVSLPEGVEEIGLQAFRNCTKLSSVSLPDSLALVGEEAFLGCNLTYKYYYDGNFHGKYLGNPSNPYVLMYSVAPNNNNYSYKLTSFTVHPNTRVIGPTAFFNKTDLKTVTLSESLQGISDYAFYGCTALTNLSLPESVSHIGAGAFYNCVGITDANTDSLKYIGMGAFGGCLGITSVDFSDKLEYIGAQAFYGCSNLGSITLSDNVSYIGEAAFYGCKSSIYYTYSNATYISSENNKYHTLVKVNSQALTSFSIPSGTKVILENAFNGCNKLTSLTLPSSLKYIGYGAFNGCSGLTSLDIPVSVTYIGNAAFSGCSSLQTLSLPYVDILHQLFGKTSGEGLYTAAYNTTAYYIP